MDDLSVSSKGNPRFSEIKKIRTYELAHRLRNSTEEEWNEELAYFAFEFGLTEKKVREYFNIIKNAGMLTKTENGEWKRKIPES